MSPEQRPSEQEATAERWQIGRRLVERVRSGVNSEDGPFHGEEGEDVFRTLYLTERDECVPIHLVDEDLLCDIRSMYYWVLDGVREELVEKSGTRDFIFTIIDPSYEDSTWALLISGERVLLNVSRKAWHFYWQSEDDMAEELEEWYRAAAGGLGLRIESANAELDADRFIVTLKTERVLYVRAADKEQAVQKALSWENNENDPDVQLSYEEALDGAVEPANNEDANNLLGESGGGEHDH